MGLYENIRDIAKSKGYSVNRLEQKLGFARSSINKFNKNTPSADKIQQIADLLDVTTDYLMSGQESLKETNLTTKDERDISKNLEKMMKALKENKDGPLYFEGKEIDDTSAELLAAAFESALRQMKIINKEKYNPNKNNTK